MPPYPVRCYTGGCGRPAEYKIAARWSDGVTSELKTYGLTCADCVERWYRRAVQSRAACRVAPGETLEEPGVYLIARGTRDQQLERAADVEGRVGRDG